MKKNLRLMALLLVAVFALAACGQTAAPAEEPAAETPAAETPAEGGMKVVIVTSPSGVDDGSFNQDNYNGILEFVKNNPNTEVKTVQETTGDVKACIQAVRDVVADYDVIVTPGFQFAGVSEVAEENPDKKFILIDAEPAPVGDKTVFENVYSMMFAEEESGFFAGVAAALETKTGKVAVVNGIAYPSNVNYQWGFESGVNYAVKHFGAKAEIVELASNPGTDVTGANVGGNYVGDFADESGGKVVGQSLIEQGVDVMLVAAGGSGNGVFTAAKEAENIMVIGCDVDQFDDGKVGDKNIVLTSALKIMSVNVNRALERVKDGSFKGENVILRADTDSTGYVSADGRNQLSDETKAKLEETYTLLKEGKIVPSANFNGHTPENFPGL